MIRIPQVRVIDEEGQQLGVMATGDALRLAQERGYDLVEVAPMASPPVTRLLDYGQYKYEQTRREKEARRHQRAVDFKEIRLRVKIGVGDFETKVRRAIEFLQAGGRVKVAVQFRGRELTHAYLGRDLLTRFADKVQEHGAVERQALLEGKSMSIVIASTHRPGHGQRPGAGRAEDLPAEAEPAEPAATEPAAGESPGEAPEPEEPPKPEPAPAPARAATASEAPARTPRQRQPRAAAPATPPPQGGPIAAASRSREPAGE